ncbi:hypothetical protein D3Z51_12480 [Clostridiaceae bacterium]|nr:hypothetical protein [Clostridiaceae bacterium]RKI12459.1 hypothetical protein D7V81_12235 [bacterium 1XD21-70]
MPRQFKNNKTDYHKCRHASRLQHLNNLRQIHFSRNPKIAAFLHEYDYVQEFGEGVDRMYKETEKAGLSAPEYKDVAFMLHAAIRNGINVVDNHAAIIKLSATEQEILDHLQNSPTLSAKEFAALLHTLQNNPT